MQTPDEAVRSDLREALRQLCDLLLQEGRPDYIRVTDGVLHAWALVRLAALETDALAALEEGLGSLTQELNTEVRLDGQYFARQLAVALERV